MEILLVVTTLAVGVAVLYVTATLRTRTRQNTAPLIDGAVKDISGQLQTTTGELKRQLQLMADDLQRDRADARLEERKIQGRLDHADSRLSSLASQLMVELETIRRLSEHIGVRQDQLSGDLQQLDHQVAQISEATRQFPPAAHAGEEDDGGTGGEAVGATAVDSPAVTDQFYAERLRFSIVPVPPESSSRFERQVRILVVRDVAILPSPQLGDLAPARTITERAEHDEGFRARLSEAASDYLASKWADPAFAVATESWITQPFPETAAAEVCNRISDGLETILQKPLEKAGTEIGLPGLEAATAAGIGSTLVLQPVTRPVGQIAKAIEITAVAVGLATGLHPLALAAGKMLARAEVHDLVARGLEKAVRSVLEGPAVVPEPARPAVVPEPAGLPEVPEPASPASRPRTFSIPSPQQPLEPPDLGRIYPTIDGPGGL
jgi:uncharacterized protein YoxC/uncharacterized protein (DUF736 family)